jgi:hypothetical protein
VWSRPTARAARQILNPSILPRKGSTVAWLCPRLVNMKRYRQASRIVPLCLMALAASACSVDLSKLGGDDLRIYKRDLSAAEIGALVRLP